MPPAVCTLQFGVPPEKSAPMEKDEGLRPLSERVCVYKYIFKHVKRLFAEATKVRERRKIAR